MDYLGTNRKLWDDKTKVHFDSEFYDVKSFLDGKDSLNPIEETLLGDIRDKTVMHLQCHFGMDSISLARKGGIVTGIDFSGEAIRKARELNAGAGTNVLFMECDVYSLPQKLNELYDVIFTSYGVVGWLPDMNRWAEIISRFLKPGGRFIMVEFHPVIWMFSYDFQKIEYNYMDDQPVIEEVEGTYADRKAPIKNLSISWNHGLSKVISALIDNDLVLNSFEEYDYSPYNCFENMVESEKGKFRIKGLESKIPMLYSITAEKK